VFASISATPTTTANGSGTTGGASGGTATFSFGVQQKGSSTKGSFQLADPTAGESISTTIAHLAVSGNTAVFCNASGSVVVQVVDKGEPPALDRIAVRNDPYLLTDRGISSGNIQVRSR